jgi:membrane protease YdiL (CAAX protease family)
MAQSNAYPLLSRAKERFGGWGLACMFGTVSGVVTAFVFQALEIKEGQSITWMVETLMPGLSDVPLWGQYALALPTLLAYAIAEEVTYRGILQGWISRLLGDKRGAVIIAVVITSIAWAIAHASNTDAIGIKLTQIFLLGLAFGWLARRYSVEAAIIAHLSLNAAVIVAAYFTEIGGP